MARPCKDHYWYKAGYESALSIAAAVWSLIPGSTCEYLSRVMATLAYPKSSCTSFGWGPLPSSKVTQVCLR